MPSRGQIQAVLWTLIGSLLVINCVAMVVILRQRAEIERLRTPRAEPLEQPEPVAERGMRVVAVTTPDAFASVKESDIPGRYRWIESGKDRGIITLNADRTFALANGQQLDSYRWALSRDQLTMEFNRQTAYYTNVAAPGVYLGMRTDWKPVRLEKVD